MRIKSLIQKKRDGCELTDEELAFLLDGYGRGEVADYQMSAWLMAVYFQELTARERRTWTRLMWRSGKSLSRESGGAYRIDKHSTGGVGDKTSLLLVPLVAATAERLWGKRKVEIPMLSGRGLSFTGGTLDKLESIPGFRIHRSLPEAQALLREQGFFMLGQSEELVPADRGIYALRDVTATVESEGLIVSSILSKKLAESLDGLVLDVKVGAGAVTKTQETARSLARLLVADAHSYGVQCEAFLTCMQEPLGIFVGHWLEVKECAEFLQGRVRSPKLAEVTLTLAGAMLRLASRGELDDEGAKAACWEAVASGDAFELFLKLLRSHGGDWTAFERGEEEYANLQRVDLRAKEAGYLQEWRPDRMGHLLSDLGGGRRHAHDSIDHKVGFEVIKPVGAWVNAGESVATVFCRHADWEWQDLFSISAQRMPVRPAVLEGIK